MTKRDASSAIEQWNAVLDPVLAAAYVRMSTEHQRYSIASQLKTIGEYAERRHIELCKIYEDAGKSGLNIEGRPGLTKLIEDIKSRRVEFSHLLVYDVSRWGRFQDADESAYYEFICRRHGVTVVYCAEPFENDGSPLAVVLKSVKRAMAAEYSRELSVKIFAAQSLISKSGQTPGGRVPYGLTRLAVHPAGKYRKVLKRGCRREVRADHLFLGPGLRNEVRVVREIFDLYANTRMSANQIAAHLNSKGCRSPTGQPWAYQTVIYMLHNDKYIGTQAYNRTSVKMRGKRKRNDPSQWVEKANAFEALVDPQLFHRAQERLQSHRKFSNEELIASLRALLESQQDVRTHELKELTGLASPSAYILRFGSVRRACELAGFPTAPNFRAYDVAVRLRRLRYSLLQAVAETLESRAIAFSFGEQARQFMLAGQIVGYCDVQRPFREIDDDPCWRLFFADREQTDLYLIIRIGDDWTAYDYLAIPSHATSAASYVTRPAPDRYDVYRHANLQALASALAKWALPSSWG